jgi:DNA-binding transcriptional ArsR family regulator
LTEILFGYIFNHMVKYSALDTIFAALSDNTRRDILERLALHDMTVTELAAPYMKAMSLPAVSKHLQVLEKAGLIRREKQGRVHHLHLNAAPMQDASAWLEHYRRFWLARLDALDDLLKAEKEE